MILLNKLSLTFKVQFGQFRRKIPNFDHSPVSVERSQNTILLASTQAVYKAPHSTVQEQQ